MLKWYSFAIVLNAEVENLASTSRGSNQSIPAITDMLSY